MIRIPGIIPQDCNPKGVSKIPRQSIDLTTFAVVGNRPILGNISVFENRADDPPIVFDCDNYSSSYAAPYCLTLP